MPLGFWTDSKILKHNQNINDFNFTIYLTELITNFYKFNDIQENIPKISVENLPDGFNIKKDGNILKIDSKIITKTGIFYTAIIILHDLYHNLKQGILSHDDVVSVRDIFGQNEMLMIDVDADIEIFRFLSNFYNFDFRKYLETIYEGQEVFRDTIARLPKLQRFLGSLISIYSFTKGQKIIYYPSLTKIHEDLFILAISDGIKFIKISTNLDKIEYVIGIFQNITTVEKSYFIDSIEQFVKSVINKIQ